MDMSYIPEVVEAAASINWPVVVGIGAATVAGTVAVGKGWCELMNWMYEDQFSQDEMEVEPESVAAAETKVTAYEYFGDPKTMSPRQAAREEQGIVM